MRTYLISYDLANPNAKKNVVAEIIQDLGPRWARPLDQTWYVTTEHSEAEIEHRLAWLLGEEDHLLIQAADNKAVLTNTKLRWFKQRPVAAVSAQQATSNVVAIEPPHKNSSNHAAPAYDEIQPYAQAS